MSDQPQQKTFRLRGVSNALVQTLLSNVRLGREHITGVGFDASGRQASVRLRSGGSKYRNVGEPPPAVQKWLAGLALVQGPQVLNAIARVVGGGISIQTGGPMSLEIARYGDYDSVAEHHKVAVMQGDYFAVPLRQGLEITLTAGLPPPLGYKPLPNHE